MRYIITLFFAIALCLGVSGRSGVSYHVGEVEEGYDFVLCSPDSIEAAKPLIIALHSRKDVGNNLQAVESFGTVNAIESGMRIDAFVLAPQTPVAHWDADKVMATVDYVMENNHVDTDRIYAIGMSMGANGVADLAAEYPDKIAAAIVLAGSWRKGKSENLSKVPLWVIRCMNDREGAIARTNEMVEEVRKHVSSRIVYSQVEGLNHRQHERLLYIPDLYEWLMTHSLQDSNRSITPIFDISTKLLNK